MKDLHQFFLMLFYKSIVTIRIEMLSKVNSQLNSWIKVKCLTYKSHYQVNNNKHEETMIRVRIKCGIYCTNENI